MYFTTQLALNPSAFIVLLRMLKIAMIFILNVLLALTDHWLKRDLKNCFLYIAYSVDL